MIVIVFFMIATIVLCTVYEAHRNRELAEIRAMEEAAKNRPKGSHVEESTDGETERQLMDEEQRKDMGVAQKASRVKTGDHSVIQDDEDFSDSDEEDNVTNLSIPSQSAQ